MFRNRLYQWYSKAIGSEFIKNSLMLLSSDFIAQIIALAIYPVITRLYSPDQFGEFSLFLTIATLLTILSTGKYELAILLPKKDSFAQSVFQLCIFINVFLFLFLFPVSFFIKGPVAKLFDSALLSRYLPLLPILVLLSGLWQTLRYYLIRRKSFKSIGVYNITQGGINSGLKYFLGVFGLLNTGLVLATIFGQFVALLIALAFCSKRIFQGQIVKVRAIKAVLKRYSRFPKFELPQAAINTLSGGLPILILSAYFDLKLVGFFSLAFTIGFRPINLFCNSMYQVLYQKMAENVNRKLPIYIQLRKFARQVLLFTSIPFILVFIYANNIFDFIFGAEWFESGTYFKLMLPWLFTILFASSISFIPQLFERQKQSMIIEIGYITLRIVTLFTGVFYNSFYLSIALFCGISSVILVGKVFWYYTLVKNYENTIRGISNLNI